jgi:diadenosine tetraphosphate (Ap4A) HIT family hydrolase
MKYATFLKTITKCPFCGINKRRILLENDGAFLTYALAPYHKYHLLVIPKRHVESIKSLTWDENVCIMALIVVGLKALEKLHHNDCTIFMRDGKALGKSVKHHVHWNIVPGGRIEDVTLDLEVRKILNAKEEKSLRKELKKIADL